MKFICKFIVAIINLLTSPSLYKKVKPIFFKPDGSKRPLQHYGYFVMGVGILLVIRFIFRMFRKIFHKAAPV